MGSRVKSPGPYSRKQTPRHFLAFYLSIPPRLFKSQPRHASHLTSHNYTKVVAVSAASSTAAAWFSSSTVRPFKSRICSAEKEMLIHVKVEELEECVEVVERGSDRVLRNLCLAIVWIPVYFILVASQMRHSSLRFLSEALSAQNKNPRSKRMFNSQHNRLRIDGVAWIREAEFQIDQSRIAPNSSIRYWVNSRVSLINSTISYFKFSMRPIVFHGISETDMSHVLK
ncbi:hypothetical protein FCM35_KLT01781 [Carex littledalei]|uniref:Uncharacterized protein n=1 Tax=Carex littledalei TaxID=544730 RepID=A0A833VRU0_9POAL|nr:hypothetical protein FCM35_KLT01781 [Carex littledalei]